nr:cellulose binding domain-containing protein [Micromonospora sp. DSM 115978]
MTTSVLRRVGTLVAAAVLATTAVAVPAAPAAAGYACEVGYTTTTWSTGFYADVRLKNLGDPWHGYTVEFTFTAGQRILSGWNHEFTQNGSEVIIRSGMWAPVVGTGTTISLGFTGSHLGTNPPPINWRVNGVPCSLAGQPPRVIAEPAALSVPEGGSGSFAIRLSHPPTGTVALTVRSSGTGVWAVQPVVVTFNPTNWSTPRPFPVYSGQDQDDVDDFAIFVIVAPGYQPATVTVTQIDNG